MRKLLGHVITNSDSEIDLVVVDEKGNGNANHKYAAILKDDDGLTRALLEVDFQNGAIKEHGINGVTNEMLLEIVADRLRGFQMGDFACRENEQALIHIEEAIHWLQQRSIDRLRRGVEGENKS